MTWIKKLQQKTRETFALHSFLVFTVVNFFYRKYAFVKVIIIQGPGQILVNSKCLNNNFMKLKFHKISKIPLQKFTNQKIISVFGI